MEPEADDTQKTRLELLTFSSGLVSVFASSSDRFLGEAQEMYGPAYAFSISVIWLATFLYVITRKRAVLPVRIREPEPGAAGQQTGGIDEEKLKPRLVWVLMIPWSVTVILWFSGVYFHHKTLAHEAQPAYQIVTGYAGYQSFATNIFDYRPVREVKITLHYADRIQETLTDGAGYFAFAIDAKPGFHAITLICSKENHQTETRFFDIHHLSGAIVEVHMQPAGQ